MHRHFQKRSFIDQLRNVSRRYFFIKTRYKRRLQTFVFVSSPSDSHEGSHNLLWLWSLNRTVMKQVHDSEIVPNPGRILRRWTLEITRVASFYTVDMIYNNSSNSEWKNTFKCGYMSNTYTSANRVRKSTNKENHARFASVQVCTRIFLFAFDGENPTGREKLLTL